MRFGHTRFFQRPQWGFCLRSGLEAEGVAEVVEGSVDPA